jgi:hypothetical protein
MATVGTPQLSAPLRILLNRFSIAFSRQRSNAWRDHVVNGSFGGRGLLDAGQIDFDEAHESGLSSRELTLLYCYHLMPEHLAACLHVCRKAAKEFLDNCVQNDQRLVLLDIGAGPLTFGLAAVIGVLSDDAANAEHIDFHYVAVDDKSSMRRRARSIAKSIDKPLNLSLHADINSGARKVTELLSECDEESTLLVAGSYVFAQDGVDSKGVVRDLGHLLTSHTASSCSVIVLNPARYGAPLSRDKWPSIGQSLSESIPGSRLGKVRDVEMPRLDINWNAQQSARPVRFYYQVLEVGKPE